MFLTDLKFGSLYMSIPDKCVLYDTNAVLLKNNLSNNGYGFESILEYLAMLRCFYDYY